MILTGRLTCAVNSISVSMHQAPVSEDERLSVLDVQNTVKRQMNVQARYAKCGREVAKVYVFTSKDYERHEYTTGDFVHPYWARLANTMNRLTGGWKLYGTSM